jgi:penicillin-binding protein-related factor A (putative recombinase)
MTRRLHVRDLSPADRARFGLEVQDSPVRVRANERGAKGRANPAHQQRRAHNGKIGEQVMAELNEVCRIARVADVRKIATPMAIVGNTVRKGRHLFLTVFAERAGCDFQGRMSDGTGRAVYAECKYVEDECERFPLSKMRPDQVEQLERALRDHCVAVLVVVRGPQRHVFAIAWEDAREHRTLGDAELKPWRVRTGEPYLARWVAQTAGARTSDGGR